MTLPPLEVQALYLDVGWGTVVAALLTTFLDARLKAFTLRTRRTILASVGLAGIACMWLPGSWSPSFWLGMAFQHPSLVLVGLSGAHVVRLLASPLPGRRRALLTPLPAATLSLLALSLYAGTFVWFPYDLYAFGYSAFAAAAIASGLALLWCWRDADSGLACAIIALAALAHALTRLPTGNAWDAMLDPLLFCWVTFLAFQALLARLRETPSLQQPVRIAR